MESSRQKSESREGKIHKNLKVKNKRGSLNALNSDGIVHNFVSNGLIVDDADDFTCYPASGRTEIFDSTLNLNSGTNATNNLTLTRQCDKRKSSKRDRDVDITSCKPCSVILERLTKKEVHNLLSRNNLEVGNVRKNNRKKRPSGTSKFCKSVKAINDSNTKLKKLTDDRNSKKTARKRSNNSITRKKRNKVKSSSWSDKTIQSNDKSHANSFNERVNKSCLVSNEEKVCFSGSDTKQTCRKDSCGKTLQIEDLSENEGSERISPEISENKPSSLKFFRLSVKKKIANKKDDVPSSSGILSTRNSEEPNNTGINSEGTKSALSLLKQLRLIFKEKIVSTKEEEACSQDPGSETSQIEDLNEIEGSRFSANNSESKVLTPNHFKLSLGKKRTNTKDKAYRQVFTSETLQGKDSDEMLDSNVVNVNRCKRLFKRKLVGTKNNSVSGRKVTKFEEKQGAANYVQSEVDEIDQLPHEYGAPRQPNQKITLEDPQVLCNRSYKQRVGSRVQNKVPIIKNVRVALVKLQHITNPSTSKQVENVKTLDYGVDKCKPTLGCKINISELQLKDIDKNCSNKTRNTKITDYFFKVDRSSSVSENNIKYVNQGGTDLILNKKYGICKDVVVSLIDLKNMKISGSQYSASKIENLTKKYANSSINTNFPSTTADVLSSCSVSPVKNLPCSYNELSTNDEQSSVDFINPLSVHDHVDKPSHVSLHTPTFPISENLLLMVHKSPQVEKYSPAKDTQHSLNDSLFVNRDILSARKEDESLKNMEHIKDYSLSNENLDVDGEGPNKDSSYQNSSELRTKSQSLLRNVRKLRNHSSDSRINNATPRSSKTLDSHVRKLTLSPGKRIILINDEIKPNKPQVSVTDINNKLLETNEVQAKSDALLRADLLSDSNELRKKSSDSSVLNKDSNTVTCQPDTYPALVSVIKSPTKVGNSKNYVKHEGPRHLPVNSMTILNCEILKGNSSWMSLNNTINEFTNSDTTMTENYTIEENESLDNFPIDNTTADKTRTSCNTTKDGDNNSFRNSKPVGTIKNPENTNSSGHNRIDTELQDKPYLINLFNAKNAECLALKHPACKNIETCSREVDILTGEGTIQKKIDDMERSDSVSEIETPMLNIPSLEPIPPVEDSIDSILVECTNQDCENLNAQDELLTDSQQEGQLHIDMDESDSDSQLGESILSDTSPSNYSHNSRSLLDEEACKNTEVTSRKECIICKKKYQSTTGLENHLKVHIRHTDSCCILCDKPLTRKNAIEHYLEHCGCSKDGQVGLYLCIICERKFKKKTSLISHLRFKHNVGKRRVRSKMNLTNLDHNKCTICQLTCNSEEDLFKHMLKHTQQEHQNAYQAAMAKKQLPSITTSNCENEDSDTPEKEKTQDKEHISSESTVVIDTLLTLSPAMQNFEVSICICHKDERLEISGGVIIEIALACVQCKTFFRTRNCFNDHYNSTSCKWSDDASISPKMFCNKCCMILNNLEEMHGHLTKHGEVDVDMKTSLLCKHCNIFFFGIGSLFYTHWSEHRNNPLFLADHYSFPKNIKVKIVEPGALESVHEDDPTESLFIADHQCQSCEKPFQTEIELKKHLKSANSCSKKVDSESQIIESPKSVFSLICSICNKEFIDKLTFDNHIEEHDTIKGFLQAPKDLDKSLENNQLTCSICKTEYDTITNYKEHLTRHEVIQKKFVCNYCTLMMDSVEDFERHSTEHLGTPEKSVACKVTFAMAKFHCKPCKIRFDNQSILDEHLATHNNLLTSSPNSIANSTTKIVPAIEKKSHICATYQQVFDDQLKLDTHVSTHDKDASALSIVDPTVIHLSDDSNSTDVEIIATNNKTNEENEEPVVGNTLLQEQQKTVKTQETKKPAFLRVKNLKELLPYDCSKCKSEFDTQINLSKHVCKQHGNPTQDKQFNYFCRICKSYPCDNDSDWNLHVLSHFPIRSSQSFNNTWYHVLKMRSGQQIFKCNVCPSYQSFTIYMMRYHFLLTHPDIYHPIFTCRVCHTFKTKKEHEILQHESAHFQQSSSIQSLASLGNNLLSPQPVGNSNTFDQPVGNSNTFDQPVGNSNTFDQPVGNSNTFDQPVGNSNTFDQPVGNSNTFDQPVSIPPVTSFDKNTSTLQPVENLHNSQHADSIAPSINLSNKLPAVQRTDNPNNFQQTILNPSVTRSDNNLPSLQPLQNSTNSQQPGLILQSANSNKFQQSFSIPSTTSSGNNFSTHQQTNNFQHPLSIPSVTSSANNLSLHTLQNLNNFQQLGPIHQPDNNFNNFQQSISIPTTTSLGSNFSTLQPADNSHKSQEPVLIPAVTSSGNNLSSLQPLQNFNNSQQFRPTQQPDNSSNDFQRSISNPPVTNSSSTLPPCQPIENSKNFHHAIWIPPLISSVNHIPSLEPLQTSNNSQQPVSTFQLDSNFNNSQQSTPTVQPNNNSNTFQQLISIPPVTSSDSNLSSLLPMDNPQWLTTSSQTFQIQINNTPPFNSTTNVMQTVPLYVTNVIYCCRICKNYQCSSEQELKVHEALHEFIQLGEPSKRSYQCKVCPSVFCPTEDELRTHMEVYHKTDKSKVSQNQTQSNVTDTQVKCKYCLQTFASSAQLTQHVYSSHTFINRQQTDTQFPNSYPYSCQLCSIDFLNEAFLHAHIRQIHPSLKLPRPKLSDTKTLYQCDTCGLLLISEATLNYHMRSHNLGLH